MPKPKTYDHLKSQKKPQIRKLRVALDSELASEYERCEGEFQLTKMRSEISLPDGALKTEITEELAQKETARNEAKAAFEKASMEFVFKALGRKKYRKLLEDSRFKPTPSQLKEAREKGIQLEFNADTFPQAIIAACCLDPVLSEEDVIDMWDSDEWAEGELLGLFQVAYEVNNTFRTVNLGKD